MPLRHLREPPPLLRENVLDQVALHERIKEEQLPLQRPRLEPEGHPGQAPRFRNRQLEPKKPLLEDEWPPQPTPPPPLQLLVPRPPQPSAPPKEPLLHQPYAPFRVIEPRVDLPELLRALQQEPRGRTAAGYVGNGA